jgi:hypothetical protein
MDAKAGNQDVVEWTRITLYLTSGQTIEPFYVEDGAQLKKAQDVLDDAVPGCIFGYRARPLIQTVRIVVNPLHLTCIDAERCPHLKYYPSEPQP